MQLETGRPSTSTAQAPQTPSPQPNLGSVTPATSRSQRSRLRCPSAVLVSRRPFTVIVTVTSGLTSRLTSGLTSGLASGLMGSPRFAGTPLRESEPPARLPGAGGT